MNKSILKTSLLCFSFMALVLCSCSKKPQAIIELTPVADYDKSFADKRIEQALEGRLEELHVKAEATKEGDAIQVAIIEKPDSVDMTSVEDALTWSGQLVLRESQGDVVDLTNKIRDVKMTYCSVGPDVKGDGSNLKPAIDITFIENYHKTFSAITGRNLLKTIELVMDDSLLCAPVVLQSIDSGVIQITGTSAAENDKLNSICLAIKHPIPVRMNVRK